jgi:hypothetical protein
MWTVKRGYNERDFLVTPFLRINNASIIYDASSDKIIAKCKIEAGGSDVTINQIRLFVFTDKWVGNRINSGIQGASILNLNGEQIDPNKEYTLIIDRAANKNFSIFT